MMRALLYWITGFLPARYINHDGAYLERYYVATIFGKRYYIHRFVASDTDGIHNHPFLKSDSRLLAGWYFEDRWTAKPSMMVRDEEGRETYADVPQVPARSKVRWTNKIREFDFHRVVLPDNGKDVWTLFSHSPREKGWGFIKPIDATRPELGHYVTEEAKPTDPAFSNWHLTAPKGRDLRKVERQIPLGMSYAAYLRSRGITAEEDIAETRNNGKSGNDSRSQMAA